MPLTTSCPQLTKRLQDELGRDLTHDEFQAIAAIAVCIEDIPAELRGLANELLDVLYERPGPLQGLLEDAREALSARHDEILSHLDEADRAI